MKVISEIEVERILSKVQNELRTDELYINPDKPNSKITTRDIAEFAIEQIEKVRRCVKTKTYNDGN